MEANHRKALRALVLRLRHLLEGFFDEKGDWQAGDLEERLKELGVRRDRPALPVDELSHLSPADRAARKTVDAYLVLRHKAGLDQDGAVAEYVRETAYTWANRLLALRCMEARELIDPAILQQDVYGGRSMQHNRLAQRDPAACLGEDDGLFVLFGEVFAELARKLPLLFDPKAPGVALRPSVAALRRCLALLSGRETVGTAGPAGGEVFRAPDALGWAYQYWNTEEKDRVFARVRTEKKDKEKKKISGADIIPATQLYTEPYMVKFLVQNSLGALWLGMRPDTKLAVGWAYFVRDADRAPVAKKQVRDLRFLDPACGSGHFLLEAFDLFYGMYQEEGLVKGEEAVCRSILENNLFGIDIDERAVQIAEAALWMKAAERTFDFPGARTHLVATNIRLPRGKDHLETFLAGHPEDRAIEPALKEVFEGLAHADELGSLLQVERPVERALAEIKEKRDKELEKTLGGPQKEWDFTRPAQPMLGAEDYEAWKRKTLKALHDHFQKEAVSADLGQAFFSRSADRGLSLFELLAGRYDVVAANPPYMGSKNMGKVVRGYVETHYEPGKRDLYAAFILRCLELCAPGGRVAMVTQLAWLFLRSYGSLRSMEITTGSAGGLLRQTTLSTLVHLGRYAFSEIGNAVVAPVLFVLRRHLPDESARSWACRLNAPRPSEQQDSLLRQAVRGDAPGMVFRPLQSRFLTIPQAPICYWLRERFFDLLAGPKLGDVAEIRQGMATADDGRFVRFSWEAGDSTRWVPFEKGGGYGKWFGHQWWVVDWELDGVRIRATPGPRVQNQQFFFRTGWTYSRMARGSMGLRILDTPGAFSDKGPGVYWHSHPYPASLNTHTFSFLTRANSPSLAFEVDTVLRAPQPTTEPDGLAAVCVDLKRHLFATDPTERAFTGPSDKTQLVAAILHSLEGWLERLSMDAYQLDAADVQAVLDETGTPAGWFPLLAGHDAQPTLPEGLSPLPEGLADYLSYLPRLDTTVATDLRLRALYEAGPGGEVKSEAEIEAGDEEEEETAIGARIPIPTETFLEELSQKLELHPISVYWLLKKGIENDGWRCLPEERRLLADRLTVTILRLLGHRWPRQIEAGEPVPEWADQDGIVPLTEGTREATLLQRVRERLAAELPGDGLAKLERDFPAVMGKPLAQWIETDFFAHHASQFKRRPIAWQIQSGRFAKKGKPAFVCLVYYHALDNDLLPKIRSQYVGPLREALLTEQRGIEAVPKDARSPRQNARRIELETQIQQLIHFDAALAGIIDAGFASPGLDSHAVGDCMQSLTRGLLTKWSETLAAAPLSGWRPVLEKIASLLQTELEAHLKNAGSLTIAEKR